MLISSIKTRIDDFIEENRIICNYGIDKIYKSNCYLVSRLT